MTTRFTTTAPFTTTEVLDRIHWSFEGEQPMYKLIYVKIGDVKFCLIYGNPTLDFIDDETGELLGQFYYTDYGTLLIKGDGRYISTYYTWPSDTTITITIEED